MGDRKLTAYCVALTVALLVSGCATTAVKLPEAPTVEEVVKLSQAGVPPDEIIRRMHEARAVYLLPASELAKLHDQGVSDRVIDYMNQTHLEAVRREEALYQRDLYLWYGWPSYRGYPGYWWYGAPYGPWAPYWY